MSLLTQRLAVLTETDNLQLTKVIKGLEKESLRVTSEGTLAQTGHPKSLGSALTHPSITTDYSEALLEFITPPTECTDTLLAQLDKVQRYTYHCLDNEYLWGASMPCMLGGDMDIPVGQYGCSNSGLMKSVYRVGLGERYGRAMQTIAGIHYNFSLSDDFWSFWHKREGNEDSLQDYKTRRYFDLIRNFRRNFWLLLYLFGASPAVCRSFVKSREHSLQSVGDDDHSLHLPFATSLRMGGLGYQSSAQDELVVNYNNLDTYLTTLCSAITEPHPDYVANGLQDEQGQYKQLNTSLLQIENEFYSTIRPKRTAESGETALGALNSRGVEYIEVRCVDINPYEPTGISAEQIYFMDVFLMYCLLADSPQTGETNYMRSLENQRRVVSRGRDPEMRLLSSAGEQSLTQWGSVMLDEMMRVAKVLDDSYHTDVYSASIAPQREKLKDASLTPSARLLNDMKTQDKTFFALAMELSKSHAEFYQGNPLSDDELAEMHALAEQSLLKQQQLEAEPQQNFDDYLRAYYAQYKSCGAKE